MKLAAACLVTALTLGNASAAPLELWLGAFGHSPTAYNLTPPVTVTRPDGTTRTQMPGYAPLAPYENVTVREVVRISAAARRIRIRFTNEFGGKALKIGAAHVALAGEDGAIIPGSDHVVTFDGQGKVTIPQGAPMLGDPMDWTLPAFAKLAVSVYYPESTVPPAHTLYTLEAYQAGQPGDQTAAQNLSPAPAGEHGTRRARACTAPSGCPLPAPSGVHVSEIDIVPASAKQTLVAFGDSITEGVVSTPGAFRGWPDVLAERLQADPATRGWTVVNAGIGSNRLLHDTPSTSALSRFDRDVLSVPGVKAVIVLLGINDIQYSHRNADEAVHAPQEIAAFRQLIARAHAKGLKIYGGTITAFEGSPDYTPQGEADRQAMNAFIRSGAFDGVVDFDAVTRDPARPTHLLADVESSGHLHPSDAGYKVMGDAVPLGLFQ
jgi:lysophospholipase L1-like esterase